MRVLRLLTKKTNNIIINSKVAEEEVEEEGKQIEEWLLEAEDSEEGINITEDKITIIIEESAEEVEEVEEGKLIECIYENS